jgi:arginase
LDPLLKTLNGKLREIHRTREEGNIVLTVGGDHSFGSASVNAALSFNPNLKVLWVDAHPDFVNPSIKRTVSQNYHGLPLSHVTGAIDLPGFTWLK